jgi:hypothetical protein
MSESASSGLLAAAVVAVALGVALVVWVWWKGRPFTAAGRVFHASRLSRHNRLFPTQVAITPASVVRYTPQWIGRIEESIHIAHIASVTIDTNLLFSDVLIETTGGANPIHCRGHHKSHAVEIKRLIEQYQSEYYRQR